MKKAVLAIVSASVMIMSTVQMSTAAEQHASKSERARAAEIQQFRGANDFVAPPSAEQQDLSNYSEGHVISAPAGR